MGRVPGVAWTTGFLALCQRSGSEQLEATVSLRAAVDYLERNLRI